MTWHKAIRSRVPLLLTLAAIDAGIFWGAQSVFPPAGRDLQQWLGSTSTVATAAMNGMRRGQAHALDIHDAVAYREVFAAQRQGDFARADALIGTIGNDLLTGPVLYQRYTDARYHASFGELKAWLDAYGDQPGAGRLYRMALDNAPSGQSYLLALPSVSDWANSEMRALSDQALPYQSVNPRAASADLAVASLRKAVHAAVRHGDSTAALALLKNIHGMKPDPVEYDQMRAEIAHSLYNDGHYAAALSLATACLARSGAEVPEAAWIAGLIAWRDRHYFTAAENFQLVAQSPSASAWTVAGGAYWAARSYRKAGAPDKAQPMLVEAAAWPRTFYGLIAARALGHADDFDWKAPVFTKAHAAILSSQPAFERAAALRDIGESGLAERQVLAINPGSSAVMREALIAYAQHAGMPAVSMRLAGIYRRAGGHFYDAALYPFPSWKIDGRSGATQKDDTALLLAIIRQESGFDTEAVSQRGAVGLMQVMPDTAGFTEDGNEQTLKDPATNLSAGQKYLSVLKNADETGGRMIPMLIAYNAGPSNLAKWQQQYAGSLGDPLLFIESLPAVETRSYVQHVMANDWIYRQRLDLAAPLLNDAAKERWTLIVPPPKNAGGVAAGVSAGQGKNILTVAAAH